MKKNIGTLDRGLRIVAGLGVLTAGYSFGSYWGLIGLIPLGTALVNWCPIYSVFGINSCPAHKS